MTIEERFFAKQQPIFNKLTAAGFEKKNTYYQLARNFMDNQFHAIIRVNGDGKVSGKVIDNGTNEEYLPLRAIHCGPFAAQVKAAYIEMLKDIATQCFITEPFHSNQANRLAKWISQTFDDQPEFVFKRLPDYAVFRESGSQKWYGLVMNIPRSRLTNKKARASEERVDIIDLRCTTDQRSHLLTHQGIHPGYHINKKNWLSVVLDDTIPDHKLFQLVRRSRHILTKPRAWLVPANQKYYDIMHAFTNTDTITWKQSTNIKVGDTVFLYVAAPVKAIIYRCQVTQINIPYHYQDSHLKINQLMKIRRHQEYGHDQFPLAMIRQHGVSSVQGPRHVPTELLNLLEK